MRKNFEIEEYAFEDNESISQFRFEEFHLTYELEGYNEAVQCLRQKSELLGDLASAFIAKSVKNIPTACVKFSSINGDPLSLEFNFAFWHKLNMQERAAIIGHEMMHVILQHGSRLTGIEDRNAANIAMDICVNELLRSLFGIDENFAPILNTCVYLEKIDPSLEKNRCFEYYYKNIVNKNTKKFNTIDCHNAIFDYQLLPEELDKIIQRFRAKGVSLNKLGTLVKALRMQYGGSEPGDLEKMVEKESALEEKRAKWGKVLKRIILKMENQNIDECDWFRENRRNFSDSNIFLPNNETFDESIKKRNVHIFMDTSGSCSEWSGAFFSSAIHFPKDKFNVKIYCFDTKVYEINLKNPRLMGFGGTSFMSLSKYIDKNIKDYDAVIVLTDGYGDSSNYKRPELWHWVITTNYTDLIPKLSKKYHINNII